MHHRSMGVTAAAAWVVVAALAAYPAGQAPAPIKEAVLGEVGEATAEISTAELEQVLKTRSALVLDARPFEEFAVSHIPGAANVAAKPDVPMSMYVSDVAEIGRLVKSDKTTSLVLYCNGPNCGKSKRLASELRAAGFTNVRRYQLGIPVWRALGGICEIELDGLTRVLAADQTAVVIDSRDAAEFTAGSLHGARNIPRSLVLDGKDVGEVKRAKDDGRLPMNDHNTRIVVIGRDAAATEYVAKALTREAFHNVSYYSGSVDSLRGQVGR
jgi:rhodanese-related sulfurtransferase